MILFAIAECEVQAKNFELNFTQDSSLHMIYSFVNFDSCF